MRDRNRVYIAGKLGQMENSVRMLKKSLEDMGYVINYDWTANPISKPYNQCLEEAHEAAEKMAHAVMECDILIVLCAKNGVGLHIETGGALVASIILKFISGLKQKDIYIVGRGNERSLFYFHKSVTRVDSLGKLVDILA